VRFLKEELDSEGLKQTTIQNKIVGLKYLQSSSKAATLYEFLE